MLRLLPSFSGELEAEAGEVPGAEEWVVWVVRKISPGPTTVHYPLSTIHYQLLGLNPLAPLPAFRYWAKMPTGLKVTQQHRENISCQ